MKIFESLRISWRSIKGHKLRSVLTTLGVIIGIGAVIAMIILGAGVKADFVEDIGNKQSSDLLVYTETTTQTGGFRIGQSPKFTEKDVEQISQLENVKNVSPTGEVFAVQLTYEDDTVAGSIDFEATTPNRFDGVEFKSGGPFSMGEEEVVINERMSKMPESGNITAGEDVTVHFRNGSTTEVEVAGVLNGSMELSFSRASPNVYMPTDPYYSTSVTTGGNTKQKAYPNLRVTATEISDVENAEEEIKSYLKSDSDAKELKEENYNFTVQTESDLVSQVTGFLDTLTAFITGIAFISLIVGSIGIANIMLVSVTERTREIGVMKAVGARKRDIIQLFLIESVILGVIGAFVGVLLGVGGGFLVTQLINSKMVFPFEWFGIAVFVGVFVGIFAGVYPAWRGSRTDPIEALRYE